MLTKNDNTSTTHLMTFKYSAEQIKLRPGRCLSWRQRQSALVQITMTLNFAPPHDLHNCAELQLNTPRHSKCSSKCRETGRNFLPPLAQ